MKVSWRLGLFGCLSFVLIAVYHQNYLVSIVIPDQSNEANTVVVEDVAPEEGARIELSDSVVNLDPEEAIVTDKAKQVDKSIEDVATEEATGDADASDIITKDPDAAVVTKTAPVKKTPQIKEVDKANEVDKRVDDVATEEGTGAVSADAIDSIDNDPDASVVTETAPMKTTPEPSSGGEEVEPSISTDKALVDSNEIKTKDDKTRKVDKIIDDVATEEGTGVAEASDSIEVDKRVDGVATEEEGTGAVSADAIDSIDNDPDASVVTETAPMKTTPEPSSGGEEVEPSISTGKALVDSKEMKTKDDKAMKVDTSVEDVATKEATGPAEASDSIDNDPDASVVTETAPVKKTPKPSSASGEEVEATSKSVGDISTGKALDLEKLEKTMKMVSWGKKTMKQIKFASPVAATATKTPKPVDETADPATKTPKPVDNIALNTDPGCSAEGMQTGECVNHPSFLTTPSLKFGCEEIEEMDPGTLLGEGHWRNVYSTVYKGKKYVVKIMKEEHKANKKNVERHRLEALIGQELGDDVNAVEVVGYCGTTLVTDWHATYLDVVLFEDQRALDPETMVTYALEVATGVSLLHSALGGTAVHNDLQPRQFLIGSDGHIKINDFNMAVSAKLRTDNGCPCSYDGTRGVGRWRSPEEHLYAPLTQKLDIYSMGMVFYCLASNRMPFGDRDDDWIDDKVMSGGRPTMPRDTPRELAEIIQECWQVKPERRPTAAEVVTRLKKLLGKIKAKKRSSKQRLRGGDM